ncbi:ABC transporter ATP-binding protein [Kiritimatiellaeota bacterium B1221]|nr:ABC transporter ATP-binding protein [Kiritimatiellaeota bacterium B1221]
MKDRHYLKQMLPFAKPYRWGLLLGLILLLLQVVSTNLMPFLIKNAIDMYLSPKSAVLSEAERLTGLKQLVNWMGVVAGAMFLFRISHAYLMTWVGQHVLRDLRMEVFRKVLALPMRRIDQLQVGRLMTRATSDLDALQDLVRNGFIGVLANMLLLVGAMIFIWLIEWRLALAFYLVIPVLVTLLTWINRQSRKAQREARSAVSMLNSSTQESLSGLFTLRVFNQRDRMRERLVRQSEAFCAARMRVVNWNTWHFPILEVTRAFAVSILILACGLWVPEQTGSLVAFLYFIRYFFRPLVELAEQSQQLQSGLASAERVFALLNEEEVPPDPENPRRLESVKGKIEFKKVNFAYEETHPVLRELSLKIQPGQFVAVVGATGAGKSTLLSLLNRFYELQSGEILLDDINIESFTLHDLRKHLGMVQQDPMLFSGTVADNIGLGREGADEKAVEAAARRVNAHRFIAKMDKGYQTDLGEGGYRLSTGQKQLIALARILLQDPEVILMLDEATASVDSETELLIQEGLEAVRNGRTCIAIAHRLSTIQHADLILVMRHGKLVEQGTHQELLMKDGYYQSLVEAMRIGVEL